MYIPNSKIIGAGGVVVPTPTVELLPANSYNRVAADLNGSTQYFTQAPIPLFGTIYSASVWFNADTVDVNQTVFLLGHVTDSSQIKFRIYLLNNVLWAQTREGESNRIGNHTVTQNTWYNVVYTRSGNTQNIYVNGALVDTDNTSSFSGTPTPSFFSIGVNISSTEYFNGRIQDAAVWNGTALTLADAQAIWASGAGLNIADYTTLSATPSSAWTLSETSGTRYDYYGAADATAFGDPGYGVGISGFIQDNDPVSLIVDSSGNGNDASQLVLAYRPLFDDIDATINGESAWVFDGSNDYLASSPITYGQEYTLIAVSKCTDTVGSHSLLDGDGGGVRQYQWYWSGNTLTFAPFNTDAVTFVATKNGVASDWNICVARVAGATVNVFINGGTPGANTITGTPQSGTGVCTLGRYTSSGIYHMLGSISYGSLFADTALTDAQINQKCSDLAAQFGLSWTDI